MGAGETLNFWVLTLLILPGGRNRSEDFRLDVQYDPDLSILITVVTVLAIVGILLVGFCIKRRKAAQEVGGGKNTQ
ncbi:hypothetical protein GN956_G25840, partial [Arapaima gigas]